MNTLMWRLNRSQVQISAAGRSPVLAVLLLITGIAMASSYHSFLGTCAAAHTCADGHSLLFRGDGVLNALVYATMVVPLLFGLFWGAPLLATGIRGRHQQPGLDPGRHPPPLAGRHHRLGTGRRCPVGRRSDCAGQLVAPAREAVGVPYSGFDTGTFDIQGIVPVAYSVFAVALGIAAGTVFRRLLPAMAITFAVFVGLRFVIAEYLRPHYMTPVSKLIPLLGFSAGTGRAGAWAMPGNDSVIGPNGQNYGNAIHVGFMPAACRSDLSNGHAIACLAVRGFHTQAIYQPANRFWAFQGIEAGIFIVLAAALIALAWRLVLTRDA